MSYGMCMYCLMFALAKGKKAETENGSGGKVTHIIFFLLLNCLLIQELE